MSKRKLEGNGNAAEGPSKQRRSRSAEPPSTTVEPKKREVLKRLFGRCCVNLQDNNTRVAEESEDSDGDYEVLDENADPLLDDVPVNMDPEQLGFFVCAQETLRFLHVRGFTAENPMFVRLRSRLLQGIQDIAAA